MWLLRIRPFALTCVCGALRIGLTSISDTTGKKQLSYYLFCYYYSNTTTAIFPVADFLG